jgi:hypothetical protein
MLCVELLTSFAEEITIPLDTSFLFESEEVVLVVVVTQPVVDARTNAPIKSKGSAYFNGILMYRFIILTIGFMT